MYCYDISQLFDLVAQANAQQKAIVYAECSVHESVTFQELDELSCRLAIYFSELSIGTGDVIAMLNDKSPICIAAMIAALKCGMPYVNLDPFSPALRLNAILQHCQPKLLIYANRFSAKAELLDRSFCSLNLQSSEFEEALVQIQVVPLELNQLTGNTPAYIMFTSGSTGLPKGAVMTHDNVLHLINWARTRFQLAGDEIFTNVNPLYFDNSVFDFYGSIFNGVSLAPFVQEETRQAKRLIQMIEDIGCTHWFSVPSLLIYIMRMKAFDTQSLPKLTTITFGGEGFPKAQLRELYTLFSQKQLINVYGPTECSCICTSYDVSQDDLDSPDLLSLGSINPNFDYHILDSNRKVVSTGQAGELFLLGPGVGKGYYNDLERTAQVFIQNPVQNRYREIGYLTGDLVWEDLTSGLMHFKSRKDYQIKHMGYRIELQEIEVMLGSLESVVECAVIYHKETDEAALGNIQAFVVRSSYDVDVGDILDSLRDLLPYYMIPSEIHFLESLPKNANGKIDRMVLHTESNTLA